MGRRCLTLATLTSIVQDNSHEWDGVPHVTGLMNGTMLEFLKIVEDYAINPRSLAYALLGTSHHVYLEQHAGVGGEMTLYLGPISDPLIQGRTDDIRPDEFTPGYVITDYKTYGSYRVGLVLGLEKGMTGKWVPNPAKAEIQDLTLQLNCYRIMAEQQLGIEVTRLQVQITVRDGGIKAAVDRGITEPVYVLDIPIVEDSYILGYFLTKRTKLIEALDRGSVEDICTWEERWQDRRCKSYCEVAGLCPHGVQFLQA
jgi:hypothetical protein